MKISIDLTPTVKFKRLHEKAVLPHYKSEGAAGFDLYSVEKVTIEPGATVLIPIGWAVELPKDHELQVRSRSGIAATTKLRVANSPGTVDEDFRGEINVIMDNIGTEPITIEAGTRIAQGVVKPVVKVKIVETTEELSNTERGVGGFGSTGLK